MEPDGRAHELYREGAPGRVITASEPPWIPPGGQWNITRGSVERLTADRSRVDVVESRNAPTRVPSKMAVRGLQRGRHAPTPVVTAITRGLLPLVPRVRRGGVRGRSQ